MRLSSLPKSQKTLVTVRNVLGEYPSPSMEHSHLIPEGIILFKTSLLTYILDGNINEEHHIRGLFRK
jgi:hypothetical protein